MATLGLVVQRTMLTPLSLPQYLRQAITLVELYAPG